jgi:prepilin-type N-terminal cleavage/methylation domain-containing protein
MTKAFSMIEILIAVTVMSIISLSMANFTSDLFNVSYKHAESLTEVNQSRQVSKFVSNEINRAEYIFPPGEQLRLSSNTGSIYVNTQDAVAFLIQSDTTPTDYVLKVFYIKDNNLYLFNANNEISWSVNTLPYSNFMSSSGNSGLIMSGIDASKTTLSYTMNENNGNSDIILKGAIGGAQDSDANALIRGVNWTISMQNKDYYLGGVSQNVPRYVKQ